MSSRFLPILLVLCPNLVQAKVLWSSTPASNWSNLIREAYPIGNGRLGAMPFGAPGQDKINLNVDSLWWGGPFQVDNYTGGNPTTEKASYLPGIRDFIFENGTGNVDPLLGNPEAENFYGSYQVLGNLTVTILGVANSSTGYSRTLDLETGIHTTKFLSDSTLYTSTVICSYPDQVCRYELTSNSTLPEITFGLENPQVNSSFQNSTCGDGYARLTGYTQLGPPLGMKYDAIARLAGNTTKSSCNNSAAGVVTIPAQQSKSVSIVIGMGTDYDQTKGNAANNFTFRGKDPGAYVDAVTSAAAAKVGAVLVSDAVSDYKSLASAFELDLPDTANSAGIETSILIDRYLVNGTGDPYLESLLFAYGRHLFISSSRDNSLPPNLQGRWSYGLSAAWSGDYHLDINLQMNHWGVDQTGLGSLQVALWNLMQDTFVPRGSETAELLYGAPGWVAHSNINTFGHTGMESVAEWADYPIAPAWMMQHVWDHYEYSQDKTWLQEQGYPLIKGVAQFWLSQLQEDHYFNDSSLVVNPCNSAEHGPTTFACTHYQQLIHQVFEAVLSSNVIINDTDTNFTTSVSTALASLDKGLHIGSWGEIKEWKIPDSYGYDFENDTHRHLSHLVGWYPGYSLSSFDSGYTNSTIQSAVATSLWSRGPGDGPDANAGWEKVWRAACWARLNNTSQAYYEVRFAIDENFADNGLSMYSANFEPFQIDANFGIVGAILAMLVVDLPLSFGSKSVHTVVLGPAIPESWAGGSVKGLGLRGGGTVDFGWDDHGVVTHAELREREHSVAVLDKNGNILVQR